MHTVQLLLRPTAYEKLEIERRFHAISHIHNVCVKHMWKQLALLLRDREYQAWRSEYIVLIKNDKLSKAEKIRKKELSSHMEERRIALGLDKSELEKYIKVCAARYRKLLSSQQVQAEAANVWSGVKSYLFSNGREIHFKKFQDFKTIRGKSNLNGIRFDPETKQIQWLGLEMQCYLPKNAASRDYLLESMSHKISYCTLKRQLFSNGWRYYLILTLDGNAPLKKVTGTTGRMGIDPGVSTMACVTDKECRLEELAPCTDRYEKQIQNLLIRMDRSRRANNRKKYLPNGTIDRSEHSKWVNSKNYDRMLRKLRVLYQKKSLYIRNCHRELCNQLVQMADQILVERMNYKSLQKRSKATERKEEASDVTKKDGSVISIHKYKKKKRFGRSLNRRAPALFLSELERKITAIGGVYQEVNTKTFKASQYDHSDGTFKKVSLSERMKNINGENVQRDLYSAFLIKNADNSLEHPDREKCISEFKQFVQTQNNLILSMKESGISMKQSFGF